MNINANVKSVSSRSLNDDTTFSPIHESTKEKPTKLSKIQNSANLVQRYKMKIPFNGYRKIFAFGVSKSKFIDFVYKNTHKSFDQTKIRISTNVLEEKNDLQAMVMAKANSGRFVVEMSDGELKMFDSLEE